MNEETVGLVKVAPAEPSEQTGDIIPRVTVRGVRIAHGARIFMGTVKQSIYSTVETFKVRAEGESGSCKL